MTPFLKQLARHYLTGEGVQGQSLFVFPSRRAIVFFNKYLSEEFAVKGGRPVLMPVTLTMDEFMTGLSDLRKADRISLMLELYDCYCEESSRQSLKAESLDDFVFWADMILSDFNDIDKYLADAKNLLRNIAEYRQIRDDFSYLTETQRKAMETFMGHFGNMGRYKEKFAQIWDLLYPLYVSFNRALLEKGATYEGAIYRSVALKVEKEGAAKLLSGAFPGCTRVMFCGLNALNECEKKVMGALKKLSLARFCWDYVSPMIKNEENRSSFFMRDNILHFGNDLPLEPCDTPPGIEVISVSSSIGQAKLLDVIMKENPDVKGDETTAVMLADESLLLPVLSSIPPKVSTLNVTMGYPMTSSSFFSLIDDICQMTLRLRCKGGRTQIYHKLAWSITGNNIFTALADEATKEKVAAMKQARKYFVDSADLGGTPLLDAIFCNPATDTGRLPAYLLSVVDFIGRSIASSPELKVHLALEMDFAMECSRTLNLLSAVKLDLSPAVWLRIFRNLLSTTSIPFAGEPLCGLQIMGPLETRALDFDNLIILSANENVFPRKRVASSFIPPMLRKDFSLPTYEYQDAVWAYYFYRMIQRPRKVWMILDSRPEGLNSGEESRYIKQLRYHFRLPVVTRYASAAPQKCSEELSILKTPQMMETLHSHPLSASAIKTYEACPLKFYYSYIEGLRSEDQVSETLDGSAFGTVFHDTMDELFSSVPGGRVTIDVLEGMRGDRSATAGLVRRHICDVLKCEELRGREIVFARIISAYVYKAISWDVELLKASGADSFTAITERTLHSRMGAFPLKGRLDRMDLFPDGRLRIVDYKTGRDNADDFTLQLFIYSHLVNHPRNPSDVPAFNSLSTYIYKIRGGEVPQPVDLSGEALSAVSEQVGGILGELDDPSLPFSACEDGEACKYCDFSKICPRCSR